MRYQVEHVTIYTYDRVVELEPHLVRLRPRSNGRQMLEKFSLHIAPIPAGMNYLVDLDGNSSTQIWFDDPTSRLELSATSLVETYGDNPFDFLLPTWAARLPIDYPASLATQLDPYLRNWQGGETLAQECLHQSQAETVAFLTTLNQNIHHNYRYFVREDGEAWQPSWTLAQRRGSCRDLAMLYVAACRAVGLAARFVSGYQGDPGGREASLPDDADEMGRDKNWSHHLHAWAEVYLPGAGWRGFDPTLGLAVADRHIAVAASSFPRYAAPVEGSFRGKGAQASITYSLRIDSCP